MDETSGSYPMRIVLHHEYRYPHVYSDHTGYLYWILIPEPIRELMKHTVVSYARGGLSIKSKEETQFDDVTQAGMFTDKYVA